jgi:hypothetical protein
MSRWGVHIRHVVPGDIILGNGDIEVTATERIPFDAEHYPGGARIQGRIVRGYGRSTKLHWWSFHREHTVDLED